MESVEKVRVSIIERLVPFLGFAVAALGSGAGAWYLYAYLSDRLAKRGEPMGSLASELVGSIWITLGSLSFAAFLVIVGTVIAIVRLFTNNTKASPLGVSFLFFGIISLVPAGLLWYGTSYVTVIFDPAEGGNYSGYGRAAVNFTLAATIVGPIAALLPIIWSVIPFNSAPGKKFGPMLSLLIVTALLIGTAVMYTWRLVWLMEHVNT